MCRTWGLIHPTSGSKGLTIFHRIMSSHSLFFTCNNLSFTVLPLRFDLFVKKLVPTSFLISLPLLHAYHVYWLLLISKWDTGVHSTLVLLCYPEYRYYVLIRHSPTIYRRICFQLTAVLPGFVSLWLFSYQLSVESRSLLLEATNILSWWSLTQFSKPDSVDADQVPLTGISLT